MNQDVNCDALAAAQGSVDALTLQCAIVDAINIYCRDVLGPGATPLEGSISIERSYPAKYAIATRVALSVLGRVPDLNWRAPLPPELCR